MDAIVRLMFGRLLTTQSNVRKFFLALKEFPPHYAEDRSSLAITDLEIFKKYPGALYFDVHIIGLMQKYPPIFFLFYVSSFY